MRCKLSRSGALDHDASPSLAGLDCRLCGAASGGRHVRSVRGDHPPGRLHACAGRRWVRANRRGHGAPRCRLVRRVWRDSRAPQRNLHTFLGQRRSVHVAGHGEFFRVDVQRRKSPSVERRRATRGFRRHVGREPCCSDCGGRRSAGSMCQRSHGECRQHRSHRSPATTTASPIA